jgi:hypothetical protein
MRLEKSKLCRPSSNPHPHIPLGEPAECFARIVSRRQVSCRAVKHDSDYMSIFLVHMQRRHVQELGRLLL